MEENIKQSLEDIKTYIQIDLPEFTNAYYFKLGYAFVDYKGNFSKIN
ncbi:MAG: hypothetical protein MJ252_23580 [archaeon]|nr:hypothetical protein [archaeon]